MMTALYIIIGVVAGALAVYLLMNPRLGRLRVADEKKQTELAVRNELLARADSERTHLEAENKRLTASSEAQQREIALLRQQHDEQMAALEQQMERQRQAAREQFSQQLQTTKEQLHNLSQQLLDVQARRLKEENSESISHLTQPLKDAITEMRRAISDSTKDHTEQSASLREQLRLMMQSNREIGEKAESLANVLRRDNKVSGNMGEIILGDLLASQGLTEGIHYEVQARLRDEQGRPLKNDDTGREMQPDVILHYPQGQDVVVDSKVSLVAYQRYVNAEDATEKERYLQEHIKSVRQHVNELARKDYSRYIVKPREAVDFVIMFVPFESSLQLALANDPTLWRDAFEHKVFISGEQNLLAVLHMIHVAWVQNQQAENQEKVFGLAEQLIDRLGDFVQRYNKVGEQLATVQKAYESAGNKLFSGRQSVIQKGRELVELGAKQNPNRPLPKAENPIGIGNDIPE